ncbi:hypothetical protein BpHYR1_053886 [Brachionus plicatilis]|uniref:Uncharacterized protein n=1 Tax=Brachionus plicatilis TaxID=10195 RepID=A0A3M7T1I6_BRAPC|nr:hypothetical protein BpHYR1_053886 [Brachionus plicatilis]
MLGFVDPLANKTQYHLFVILFILVEVIYSLECDSNFDFSVRQISFCSGRCSVNGTHKSGLRRALSLSEFDATCKQPKSIDSIQQASQYYYSSKAVFGEQSGAKYRVFIFDFHLVSGNVYIDFKKLNLAPNSQPKPQTNVSLIISLVSHQFMTFRIFNLPSRRSVYINDIKILLNGAASLDLMEKKGDLEIQVHHSPLYHFSPDRKEWIHYLNTLFAMKIDGYVEYLSQFCHISHIRIDVNKMVHNLHNTSHFEDFVRPLEEMESLSENIDAEVAQYHLGKTCFLNINESVYLSNFDQNHLIFAINFQPHIFLDIGQNWDKNENYLKIFIKECDITKIYNLILYVNKQFDRGSSEQRLKKLIIDENYCHLRIYI